MLIWFPLDLSFDFLLREIFTIEVEWIWPDTKWYYYWVLWEAEFFKLGSYIAILDNLWGYVWTAECSTVKSELSYLNIAQPFSALRTIWEAQCRTSYYTALGRLTRSTRTSQSNSPAVPWVWVVWLSSKIYT